MLHRFLPLLLLILVGLPALGSGYELQPLTTRNLAPSVIGFGLPTLGPARVLQSGSGRVQVTYDLVSNFTESNNSQEQLLFDGETSRVAISGAYGVRNNLEFGAELPWISHQGGFLDGFVEGWHDTFGLPQGGREQAESDRIDYRYTRAGGEGFSLNTQDSGFGDLSLRVAWQFWQSENKMRSLVLRSSLKLPTGDADRLTGSGSTDLALWLSGEQRLDTDIGPLIFYGGGGALLSTDGDLLADQRRNLVGLVSLGFGWQALSRVGLQLQFDGHSALYEDSRFKELNKFAGQLSIGGSLALTDRTVLELAVVEDVVVDTTPDVVFHLAIRQQF